MQYANSTKPVSYTHLDVYKRQGYQNCLDYTKMNEEMQAHKEEILKGYEELSTSIRDCFNPVSYTHLDVYKRQDSYRHFLIIRIF